MASMDPVLEQRHYEVREWLKGHYGGEKIPPYEVNATTIDALYELMRVNIERDRECGETEEMSRRFADEYSAEAERLDGLLASVGLPQGALSQSGIVSMRTLSSLALTLELPSTSLAGYVAALSDLSCSLGEIAAKNAEEERKIERVRRQMTDDLTRLSDIRRAAGEADAQAEKSRAVTEKRLRELPFYKGKAQEYTKLIGDLKAAYRAAGFDESVAHAALAEYSAAVAKLRADNATKSASLAGYNSLPPDLALAQVKIEEARRQLDKLDAALSRGIDLINV